MTEKVKNLPEVPKHRTPSWQSTHDGPGPSRLCHGKRWQRAVRVTHLACHTLGTMENSPGTPYCLISKTPAPLWSRNPTLQEPHKCHPQANLERGRECTSRDGQEPTPCADKSTSPSRPQFPHQLGVRRDGPQSSQRASLCKTQGGASYGSTYLQSQH
jgi:hypothetical protein